ncbi:hypothetical protein MAR_030615, partial [Mya arenaria]
QKGLSLAIRIALFYLLCAQCVEPNPGPPKVNPGTNTTKEDEPVEPLPKNPELMRKVSLKMSDVMADIGVTQEMFCAMYNTVEGKEGLESKADGIHSLRLKQLPAEIMDTKSFIMSEKIPNRWFKEILKIQCCFLGSVWASFHIANKWAFPDDINIPYAVSLDADLTSCRLKFASMLYRSRQYTLAEQVLAHVESLLHPNVWQWCGCQGRPEIKPTNELVEMIRNLPDIGMIDQDGLPMIEVNEH